MRNEKLFVLVLNGASIKDFKRRANAEAAFSRYMHRINVENDMLYVIEYPEHNMICQSF